MAKDDEPVDDLHSITSAPLGDVPVPAPVSRLDYGDAAQRAEMDEIKDVSRDEPIELVDAPIQIREPFTTAEKRRNQRRMPT
ncbi:hypothetical protein ACFP2T_03795 [Plantactinospora solaniradicis]|uniref:Uncharacterized protein n=1 Tax=Plantactinospora solaniradicis TaxID=1723736 RepID=A0ABW1K310_9ACTN